MTSCWLCDNRKETMEWQKCSHFDTFLQWFGRRYTELPKECFQPLSIKALLSKWGRGRNCTALEGLIEVSTCNTLEIWFKMNELAFRTSPLTSWGMFLLLGWWNFGWGLAGSYHHQVLLFCPRYGDELRNIRDDDCSFAPRYVSGLNMVGTHFLTCLWPLDIRKFFQRLNFWIFVYGLLCSFLFF